MRYARLFPIAALGILAACSDPATSPDQRVLPTRPSFAPGTGAHFLSISAAFAGGNSPDLIISFREAGLGNSPTPESVHIEVVASATALYACINGGSKHPNAANKEEVTAPVGGSGDFPIQNNGSASGTITLSPPDPTLDCPTGQSLVLASVTYTNVNISDTTNGVLNLAVDGGGPFTKTLVDLSGL
jgi:hypothetical protein